MEPIAEGWGWEDEDGVFKNWQHSAKENLKVCVLLLCIPHLMVHWRFREGRDGKRQYFTLSIFINYFLWKRKTGRQWGNVYVGEEKQELFTVCALNFWRVCAYLYKHTHLLCVGVCVWTWGSPFPSDPVCWRICVFDYSCEHMCTNPGVEVSPVCMLMSNRLIGASQCVEWQLTYSAIQRGS